MQPAILGCELIIEQILCSEKYQVLIAGNKRPEATVFEHVRRAAFFKISGGNRVA